MAFTNKSDVKNHLSPRERSSKRLYRFVGPSDALGFSGEKGVEPGIAELPEQPNVLEGKVYPGPFPAPEVSKAVQE